MEDQALITAASNKFFPSVINLIGSIKANYPQHPKIFVYDLGLVWLFRKELENIENVAVLPMPRFCKFWRSCYTWKTYILSHPLARLNFYLDAGTQVLRPLTEIYGKIDREEYFAVGQKAPLEAITPSDYKKLFPVEDRFYAQQCITAGIFGFKANSAVMSVLEKLFKAGLNGLALGFSPNEAHRNKGVDRSEFVRDCKMFRHDTTLLSLLMRQNFKDFVIHDVKKYGGAYSDHDHPEQLIWNIRMNYLTLQYLNAKITKKGFSTFLNRIIIYAFIYARIVRLFLKGKVWNIKNLKSAP